MELVPSLAGSARALLFTGRSFPPRRLLTGCCLGRHPHYFKPDSNFFSYHFASAKLSIATTMATKTTEDVDPSMACPRCTDVATKVCGGCKDISYCSPECQQADWNVHKLLCKGFKDFAQPAPSANMRRIVVFLPDEKKPRFMWAPVQRNYSGYDLKGKPLAPWENIDEASVIDTKHLMRPSDTNTNAWTGQPLGYAIQVLFDDNFQTHYTERNQAVVFATQGMDAVGWRGPIIAYCGTLRGGDFDALDIVKLHDMDMRACSHLVAYLINHYNKTPEQMVRRGPKVKCVKVSDSVDRKTSEVYKEVLVPPSHPMFWGQSMLVDVSTVMICEINQLVRFLLTRIVATQGASHDLAVPTDPREGMRLEQL
jgi:hypothetical protein